MSERYRCKECGAEFECEGVVIEGKTGHTATQFGFKKIKEGNNPNCHVCGGNFIWIPALRRIEEKKESPGQSKFQSLLAKLKGYFRKN